MSNATTTTTTTARAQELTALPYEIRIIGSQVEGRTCFEAVHPDLPGCRGWGWTREEALRSLDEARGLFIESLLEDGQPVPLPRPIAQAA